MYPFNFQPTEEILGGYCSKVYANATQVLKVPWQGEELTTGYQASLLFAERGGPKIFAHDPASGTILMERIVPGITLCRSELPEDARIQVFAEAVKKLSGIPAHGFPDLFGYFTDEHPILSQLLVTTESQVFLHGDLHHGNLLQGPNAVWVTIDPKGVVGDPNYEAAAWLRNPIDQLGDAANINRLLDVRLEYLTNTFGWKPWRMMAWCWVDLLLTNSGRADDSPWSILQRELEKRVISKI